MADTMYALALEVSEGRLSAEEAAERMSALVEFDDEDGDESEEDRRERFQEGTPTLGDNSFARVTSLYFAGKLTKEQYETLHAGLLAPTDS